MTPMVILDAIDVPAVARARHNTADQLPSTQAAAERIMASDYMAEMAEASSVLMQTQASGSTFKENNSLTSLILALLL